MDDNGSNTLSDGEQGSQSGSEVDQLMNDPPANKCFPSDEFFMLSTQMTQLKTSQHSLWALHQCLQTARNILQSPRIRQADLDCVRRFFREELYGNVDKVLQFPQASKFGLHDAEEHVLETLQLLVLVAAEAFEYRTSLQPSAQTLELDADLQPVAQSLLHLFNMHKPLHSEVADAEVPETTVEFNQLADQLSEKWALSYFEDNEMEEGDVQNEEPMVERHRWLTHLVNLFGHVGGFNSLLLLLRTPGNLAFPLVNMMTAVLSQAIDVASAQALEKFRQVATVVLEHLAQLVAADSERLANYGEDRTYHTCQILLNTNLPRFYEKDPIQPQVLVQIKDVQCTFVLKMLESSNFNKLLSGVTECKSMLKGAVKDQKPPDSPCSLQSLVKWMNDNNIVQRILRTNLHQRQYVEQVQGIMLILTQSQYLTSEHLDMLWAVTEKEDTYEAVKTHMFDLLAEIASRFVPSQLNMLFAKLERSQDRSVQHTARVLRLLQHLARSDKELNMYDKVIQLVWDLTTPADTPSELVATNALSEVVESYMDHIAASSARGKRLGGDSSALCFNMMLRCLQALVKSAGGQVPLLHAFRELFKLLPVQTKGSKQPQVSQDKAVEILEGEQHNLHAWLVAAICSKVAAAHQALAAATTEQPMADNNEAAAAAADAREAALASLAEGAWSYTDMLREYLITLRTFALNSHVYFASQLTERLWDTLMVDPPCSEDQLPATQSFFKAGFQGHGTLSAFFEAETQRMLLEQHMVRQDASRVVHAAAKLFVDIFQQVNLEAKTITYIQKQTKWVQAYELDMEAITGLDFIWAMYLTNSDERVANLCKMHLLHLYHSHNSLSSAPYRKALVERIMKSLQANKAVWSGDMKHNSQDVRATSRLLALALAAINAKESPTMPPVPAHKLAWRGTPLVLEIQREGASRLRLASHSNEYVGLLRERLAQQMGCSAKCVRMFCLGHELSNDASTLPSWDSKNRAVVTVMASPEPNRFTLSPADYRTHFQQTAFSWLLSQSEKPSDSLYAFLLQCVDGSLLGDNIPNMALELLGLMPTYPDLLKQLSAALEGADKQQHLAVLLGISSDNSINEYDIYAAPHQTLYALQALCVLLFPTFDDRTLPAADAEAMAEASACPSPAAGAGPSAAAVVAKEAAAAALAEQQQLQQHREVQQQDFLQSRGLEVVLAAAQKAASAAKNDLQLQRQLSELLVTLLHNLVDAATSWSNAAGGGDDIGMSAAESEAVVGAPAAGSAAASSAAGATGAVSAADSGVVAMAGVQQQQDSPSADDAASSPQRSGTHTYNTRQRQQQGAKQQQGRQQRQRAGDLPPLPPLAVSTGALAAAPAAQQLAAVFGINTLKLVADSLLEVAVDASHLWGSGSTPLEDDDSNRDVVMVKNALQLLLRLLEQQPALVQHALIDVQLSPLVTTVLLNPNYTAVRKQAAELLERLVSSEAQSKELLFWLLKQLDDARRMAPQAPSSCQEFYELLASVVGKLGCTWTHVPQDIFKTAAEMLDEEVQDLKAAAAAPPLAAAAAPVAQTDDSSSSQAAAEAACTLLQGRLQLILALVRTLDRRAVGSDRQGALIKLLLQDFLFPEAVQQVSAAAAGQLNLQAGAASTQPHCATASCRKAALELLAELMSDSPASLDEGVRLLVHLHYDQQVLTGWNLLPKPLRAPGQYMGLKNGGATCYMNAVLQQLFLQPCIRAGVLGAAAVDPAEAADSVFAQLQAMFAVMALGKGTYTIPTDFWWAFKDYDGSPIDVKEHQDAYEFFTRLQDFVDQHLISTGQQPAIKPVMGGKFVQQIICRGVDFTSEREEEFYQVSVDVKGMGSLEKSLDDYVKGELMEGDNAYLCEELGKRVPAVKRSVIKQLPQMLCVHLKRFEFDYHSQTRYKVRDRFEFPLEIDMFKYTADGLAAADQQQKAGEQQQKQLQRTTSSSAGSTGSESGQLQRRGSTAAIDKVSGGCNYMYDLMGIVVHSGSAFTGHYYSFIKERTQSTAGDGRSSSSRSGSSDSSSSCSSGPPPRQWYSFDDKQVSAWDITNLEYECFGGKPSQDSDARGPPKRNEYDRAHSAYMLFYERRQAAAGSAAAASSDGSQQQQQQQQARAEGSQMQSEQLSISGRANDRAADDAADNQPFIPPYGMPVNMYRKVIEQNLQLMWQQHVLDKDYFRFVRQLVDSRGDLGQLSSRKSRRRDAGGVISATATSRTHSSMSCDAAGQQQQAAAGAAANGYVSGAATPAGGASPLVASTPEPREAEQAMQVDGADGADTAGTSAAAAAGAATAPSPMAMSPAGKAPAAAAEAAAPSSPAKPPAATGQPGISVVGLSTVPEQRQSPGPSSRRGEEAEAVAQALMRLGVLFQFQVYLRANDSLRGEQNVWFEALTSLMGSGSSSTSCMQLFLELLLHHPQWLFQYLGDAEACASGQPKKWAVDIISWVLEAAAKRVSRQLSLHIAGCTQQQQQSSGGGSSSGATPGAAPQQQQLLPPLASAVIAAVDKLVGLVRECVPAKQGQVVLHDCLEMPSDVVRVLLRYTAVGPFAAAHLMQVHNLVPDLADLAVNYVLNMEQDNEIAYEELTPFYELLAELLQHATNLPQLAAEFCNQPQAVHDNPYIRDSALPFVQAEEAAAAAGGVAAASGILVMLPQQAYRSLTQDLLLKGAVQGLCAALPGVLALVGLLTWNNAKLSEPLIRFLAGLLHKQMNLGNNDTVIKNAELVKRNWALMLMQPDAFKRDRVSFLLVGAYTVNGRMPPPRFPGITNCPEAVTVCTLDMFKLLHCLLQCLKDTSVVPAGPQLRTALLKALLDLNHISSLAMGLLTFFGSKDEWKEPAALVAQVMTEMQQASGQLQTAGSLSTTMQ